MVSPLCRSGRLPLSGIYRILVCRPNHRLGNMLLMTPLIAELEQRYKGAEIDIVAEGPAACDVFATYFSVRNIYCLPPRGFKRPLAFLAMIAKIRRNHYDLIIDPCVGSTFSRVLTRAFRGRCKLGFDDAAAPRGLTHVVPTAAAPRHMAKRPVSLLRWACAGEADAAPDVPPLDICLTAAEQAQGRAMLDTLLLTTTTPPAGLTIGIFANATGAKRYPGPWWHAFIDALRQAHPQCAIVEIIPGHGRSMLDGAWPGYYSTSIRRMSAVMSALDVMISADCGVMHLAVASRVPTLGLFSVTDAAVYGPYGGGDSLLISKDDCATRAGQRTAAALPQLLQRRLDSGDASFPAARSQIGPPQSEPAIDLPG
jgi:heptosyltransferase-3